MNTKEKKMENNEPSKQDLAFATAVMIVALLIIIFASGCGYRQSLRVGCHLGGQTCDNLFGKDEYEQEQQIENLDKRLTNAEKEIESLKTMVNSLISDVGVLSSQYSSNSSVLNLLQSQLVTLNTNAEANSVQITNINNTINELLDNSEYLLERIDYQQTVINSMLVDITNLQNNESIAEIYDVCGDKIGYFDEVIIKTSSGKLLAYFESSGDRFLTVLTPGNYISTDKQKCKFTVNSSGQIVNEHL
jgi:septal ring factor EnvC (AmiA/AmiB activator)